MPSNTTTTTTKTAIASAPAQPAPSKRRSGGFATWGFRIVVVALLGFNAWWFVRDVRPIPDLKAIGGMVRAQRYDQAEQALSEHLRRSPYDGAARMMLARVYAAQEDLRRSADALHEVPFWWPTKQEALYLEGEAYHHVRLARQAEAAWKKCVYDDPLHPTPDDHFLTAVTQLIGMYAVEERWEEARAAAWQAYDRVLPQERPSVVIMLFRTHLQRIDPQEAATRLREYLDADPNDHIARVSLARIEHELDNEAEAERLIRQALNDDPEDPRAWREWLQMLKDRGDLDALAEAVALVPSTLAGEPDLLSYRALAFEHAGDLESAADIYKSALEQRPFEDDLWYRLSLCERRLGRTEAAETSYARSRPIRAARERLLEAYQDYVDATNPDNVVDPKTLAEARANLAELCVTLGWDRLAVAL